MWRCEIDSMSSYILKSIQAKFPFEQLIIEGDADSRLTYRPDTLIRQPSLAFLPTVIKGDFDPAWLGDQTMFLKQHGTDLIEVFNAKCPQEMKLAPVTSIPRRRAK